MKAKNILLPILLILLALFVSCDEKPQFGSISIDLDKSKVRMIEPTEVDLTCDYYTIEATGPNGLKISAQNLEKESFAQNNLLVGQWTFTVKAYNSSNVHIAEKSETVTIEAGKTTEKEFN